MHESIMHKYNNSIYTYKARKQTNGLVIVYSHIHAYALKPKKMENWSKAFIILYQASYKAQINI